MGHRTPRVIHRWWLREPDVACVAGKLPAAKCTDDGKFEDAFARFLPDEPNIRTLKRRRERT